MSRPKTEYMCCNGNSEGELKIGEEAIPNSNRVQVPRKYSEKCRRSR